ncbi:hypothetical protein QJS10_CPA03g00051 [Acorus calamus]|uniref:Uncharacterized protein n=1 Tax=Acorus calamus TaxID=4465 RepID=A0AAV9F5W5_ACOCL|nr:hypothetical protein QJS10_CPA03g00051 [Acorus calamus]
MEEEKRKRKNNKKKKNKQARAPDDAGGTAAPMAELDRRSQASGTDAEKVGVSGSDLEMEKSNVDMVVDHGDLEKKIEQLQNEKDSWIKNQANMEEMIEQLQREKDSWILKEGKLQGIVKHLKSDRDFLTSKENSNSELIANLNEANVRLQSQVVALEESRNAMLLDNEDLLKRLSISIFEPRIQQPEREDSNLSSPTKEVTKVNDLHTVQDGGYAELPSMNGVSTTISTVGTGIISDSLSQNDELLMEPNEKSDTQIEVPQSYETVSIDNTSSDNNKELAGPESVDTNSEILQVLPEENHSQEMELQELQNEYRTISTDDAYSEQEKLSESKLTDNGLEIVEVLVQENETVEEQNIPLSDAPLIGAPFRLISFFARYVSGADLVNKSHPNSGR